MYETDCRPVAVFVGVSDTFNQKNINKSTKEALRGLAPLLSQIEKTGLFCKGLHLYSLSIVLMKGKLLLKTL